MKLLALGSVDELLALLGSAVGAVALTAVGLLAEQAALRNVVTGQTVLGAWELVVGGLFLFFGVYLLGYQGCWLRLQRLRDAR